MKTIIVKAHKRKGRVVRSHARKSHARLFPDGPAYIGSQTMDDEDTSMSDGYFDENGDWIENSHARMKKVKKANKAKSKAFEKRSGKTAKQARESISTDMMPGFKASGRSIQVPMSKHKARGKFLTGTRNRPKPAPARGPYRY